MALLQARFKWDGLWWREGDWSVSRCSGGELSRNWPFSVADEEASYKGLTVLIHLEDGVC